MRFSVSAALATVALAGGLAAAGHAIADEPATMQAGKWRTTTQFSEISIPGLPPQVAGMVSKQMNKGRSFDFCLKPEDVRQPGPENFAGKNAKDCKYEDWSYAGGVMRATLVCNVKGQGTLRQKMVGTGSPTAYDANVDTTITGGKMGTMRMKGRVTGKRIGGC